MSNRIEGRVKTANSRGFGFIETKEGIDFFFHHTQYTGDWKKLLLDIVKNVNVVVSFEIDDTAKDGPRAINVQLISVQGDDKSPMV